MSSPRLKILYVVPGTRQYAGIERVVDEVSAELADKHGASFDVDVLFTRVFENYEVGERSYNKIVRSPTTKSELLRVAREVVSSKEYDLVIVPQIEATVIFWMACLGLPRKFVLHLHGNPRRERRHLKAKILFSVMRRLVLPRLAAVFGTSPRQLQAFRTQFPSDIPHVWVPNPVRQFETHATAHDAAVVTFVNVARFAYQKGQDLLIAAFAQLCRKRPNVRLRLVGYGPNEAQHRETIERLGLTDVVSIEYHPHDPGAALSTSDVYVCSSRWEGWSIAICEALRCGLPVVSIDCEFGPSDILTDRRLGRLVPLSESDESVEGLVEAMSYYCDHLHEARRDAEFRKTYIQRFNLDRVARVHADAIASVVRREEELATARESRPSVA